MKQLDHLTEQFHFTGDRLIVEETKSFGNIRHSPYNLWLELRPQQWVKNLVVVAPLLFSRSLLSTTAIIQTLVAFLLFCLMSSSVYLLNDIKDCDQDRLHPTKRNRPLASGRLGVDVAWGAMLVLLVAALSGAWILNGDFGFVLCFYWLVNVLYSTRLKRQVILDVFIIALGFLLRVIGGGVAIQVEISHWLLLCTLLLALFLSLSKRRHELLLLGEEALEHRQTLAEYSPGFLDMMIAIVTASTVMSYALYTVSEETVTKFHTKNLFFTLPFVLYGIFRYLYLVYDKHAGGDPTHSLLTDRPILINLCLWAVIVAFIIY